MRRASSSMDISRSSILFEPFHDGVLVASRGYVTLFFQLVGQTKRLAAAGEWDRERRMARKNSLASVPGFRIGNLFSNNVHFYFGVSLALAVAKL